MIRLFLILLLFLASLLTICMAPTYHLWMVAILVDEFPWIFMLATIALLVWGIWIDRFQLAGTLIGIVALLFFAVPIIQAYAVSATLRHNLGVDFGGKDSVLYGDAHPFRWTNMFNFDNGTTFYRTYTYDTALTLDFYPAQGSISARPCIVVIHGGSWSGGDAQQLPELNSVLALQGYNVACINYRLAPRYQSPAPVQDVAKALAYLKTHAGGLRIDTTRFVLLGRSAGAQIALMAAYTLPDIRGVISYYGPADMVWGWHLPTSKLIMDSRKVMEDYLGGPYEKIPAAFEASSPIGFVTPRTVPTLLIHGKKDVLVAYGHSTRLAEKLKENGVPHYLLTLPWATHGCDYTLNGPSGQLATYSVEAFLHYITQVR